MRRLIFRLALAVARRADPDLIALSGPYVQHDHDRIRRGAFVVLCEALNDANRSSMVFFCADAVFPGRDPADYRITVERSDK